MEFKILGPLEVRQGDRLLALSGPKQRLLLGVLLLRANEVVSSDRLIEALWGERPPETARKALQMHVSQLRDLLEPGRARGGGRVLLTRPPGYELRLEDGELDLHLFEQAVSEARAAAKAGRVDEAALGLREALALWRGPPLADLGFESFVQDDIARLEELRVAALEDRIDADLALGRDAEVLPELESLASEHPLRERVRAQLMLALYRSGRQAEALEVYRDTRGVLVDELGIEPGKQLRELEDAILRQDPVLDRVVTVEGAAPEQSRGTFVGRQRELETLLAGLEDSLAGHGGLYLLVGEPGIGKSRLAEELAGEARSRGAQVLVGRCWEAGGAPAYWPWIQSLRTSIRDTEPKALRPQLGPGAGDLAQLLPELRELFPDLPDPTAPDSEAARVRMFDAATSFLKRAAAAQPLLLVLDDIHAADEPSLLLLRFLARELSDSRLLVIGAYRDVDPTVREPLAPTLAELVREPATHQISLTGLSGTDVADYIELAASSVPPPRLVEAIHDETEGNPLFVTEVVRLLDAEGRRLDAAELSIPPSIRSVISQRVGRLSDRCRGMLTLASVLGREFGLDALGQLSELPHDQLLESLDESMTERIVGEVPGSPGRLRFAHALIRDTLYDDLTPARRLQLHTQAGEALEIAYAAHLDPHLAELAHHFFIAAPAASAPKAVEYAGAAGERAVRLFAYEEAVRLYQTALEAMKLDQASTDAPRCDLLLALADAQGRAGDGPGAKSTFLDATEVARLAGLPELFARAALGYGGRFVWARAASDERLVPLLEDGLAALGKGDSVLRVKLLSRLAAALRGEPSRERRERLREEAVDTARRLGDQETLAYALAAVVGTQGPERSRKQLAEAGKAVNLAEEIGDKERAFECHEGAFWLAWQLGDPGSRETELMAITGLARELRQPAQLWLATAVEAALALAEGRFAEAEQLIERAAAVGEHAQSWNATVARKLQLFVLSRELGRLEAFEPEVSDSADDFPSPLVHGAVLAYVNARLGRDREAEAVVDELTRHDLSDWHLDEEWLFSICVLAESCVLLGDRRRAGSLYDILLPHRSLNAIAIAEVALDSVSRTLGVLATALGQLEDAMAHFDEALVMDRRMEAWPWVAHTEREYALMLIERGDSGDRKRASDLLASAVASYRELGMGAWGDRAARLLE
jgi:DNA-binding SARP family transcriptional activator